MAIRLYFFALFFISFSISSEGTTRDTIYAHPQDVHISVWYLTREEVPGGLVDGPVYASVYQNLKVLLTLKFDEFTKFQGEHVVYHDDFGDYSTNERTMDGTADAIFMMTFFGEKAEG